MTMFIKTTNGEIDQFPYTVGQFRRDNPNTSFPRNIPDDVLAAFGVFPVTLQERPQTSATQVAVMGSPALVNGSWSVGWTVRDKTADETAADRQGMRVFKRAFNYAMSQRAPTATLLGSFPNAATLLEAVDALEQTLDPYHPLRLARRDIIEYIRIHPDVSGFQQVTGLTDAEIDDLFRVAMAYEAA